MCGIAGILAPEGEAGSIERMVAAMRHRGPDDSGTETIPLDGRDVRLGSSRLSIIDLSAAGHMPMADAASGNRIVYNGEVYNFRQLRRELEAAGESFVSRTDTEVILRLYGRAGAGSVDRLRGMFAFAVWDSGRREVFLARDRVGKKPLYYALPKPGVFVFASEVRTILASGLVEPRLDLDGVEAYLANGFTVSPRTLVRGVRSLLPGRWMRVGAEGRILEEACYWRPPRPETVAGRDLEGRLADLRELFRDAVISRLVSDVPLSVFLSGGMDSSAVLGCLGPSGADLRTFSITFSEPEFDESAYSRRVATFWKTRHTEVRVGREQFFRWLPDALASMDQPTFDGVNTYCVSRAARESGSKVALSGLGADELFGGYPFLKAVPLLSSIAPLAWWLPRSSRRWLRARCGGGEAIAHVGDSWKVFDLLGTDDGGRAPIWRHRIAAYQVAQNLFPSWARQALHPEACAVARAGASGERFGLAEEFLEMLRADIDGLDRFSASSLVTWRLFLGERCLRDTDTMSMGVSLEVRAPFTDHLFVEQVLKLPGKLRCAGPPDKPFEYRVLEPFLRGAWAPRKKMGFVMPFRHWLSSKEGRAVMEPTLRDARTLQSVGLRPEAVRMLWEKHGADPVRVPWSRVWSIFALANWCRRWKVSL